MAIKPICNKCKKELDQFGAILLGPPDNDSLVKKYHLCKDCYDEILNLIEKAGNNKG